ncbi:MAG TPA: DUF3574 domain-containing protein [Rhizomicrobium sp.]|nr:DUF3574 domain-containing protein [Rhizomicrobium sp.]
MTRFAGALFLVALSGCAPERGTCLLDSQARMTVVELFFGRDIPGREPLTDREWSDFAASVISKELPQGFTVTDADGEWRDPATQALIRERTKILIVAGARSPDLASRVSRVRDAYGRMYRQTSVGVLSYDACGAF